MAHFLSYAQAASQLMQHLCDHNAHGYSQPNREGDGTVETIRLSDGTKAKLHGGDYDCSKAVIECYAALGVDVGGATYTGNMIECMVHRSGSFRFVAPKDADDGDVLLRSGHTEMLIRRDGKRYQAGFRGSEHGTITGTKGDQTGREAAVSIYDPERWTWCLRCTRTRVPVQDAGKAANNAGLNYRAHVEKAGWLKPVHDGQTAGTTGQSARMEAMKITPPEGLVIDVLAHIQRKGNMEYKGIRKGKCSGIGSSSNDPIIGTVGLGLRLEAFEIKVVENTTGKTLKYRAHVQGAGWLPWMEAREGRYGSWAGTVGEHRRMEAVQLKLV